MEYNQLTETSVQAKLLPNNGTLFSHTSPPEVGEETLLRELIVHNVHQAPSMPQQPIEHAKEKMNRAEK